MSVCCGTLSPTHTNPAVQKKNFLLKSRKHICESDYSATDVLLCIIEHQINTLSMNASSQIHHFLDFVKQIYKDLPKVVVSTNSAEEEKF